MRKILFILMLVLITSLSFADNDIKSTTNSTNTSTITLEELKPSIPSEATFEEDVIDTLLLKVLSPIIPKEANFEE